MRIVRLFDEGKPNKSGSHGNGGMKRLASHGLKTNAFKSLYWEVLDALMTMIPLIKKPLPPPHQSLRLFENNDIQRFMSSSATKQQS